MSGRHKISQQKNSRRRLGGKLPLFEPLELRQLLSTYYVSPYGSDSHSGTSTGSAWRTISHANSKKLHWGDKLLFQGGKTFNGSIWVSSNEGGVTIGSYGSGRATIYSGSGNGIDIAGVGGVTVSNLIFVGNGMHHNSVSGVHFHTGRNHDISGFNIKNVEARAYGHSGIDISIDAGSGSSLSNVKIDYAQVHNNHRNGINVSTGRANVNHNWVIQHVAAYNNLGDSHAGFVTGSGIVVDGLDGALIQNNRAFNNGAYGAAPVGIWAMRSNRVTIQNCESYNNHTRTSTDGGGFDFDWDVTNSVMQYNYSHGNDGPGFLLAAGTHRSDNNIIRYNVTENDGRRNGRGGIQLWGNVTNGKIYNNTVYTRWTGNSNTAAFYAHDGGSGGKEPRNIQVINNVFTTTGGAKVVNLSSGTAAHGSFTFRGNAYHSYNGSVRIQWGGSMYYSLTSWQNAKGQEKNGSTRTGYQGDPHLKSAGHGGTIGNTSRLRSLWAYQLQGSSPLINRGQSQPSYLSSTVGHDYFGDTALRGGRYDIGVDEVR
jgi:hypothetical protein